MHSQEGEMYRACSKQKHQTTSIAMTELNAKEPRAKSVYHQAFSSLCKSVQVNTVQRLTW